MSNQITKEQLIRVKILPQLESLAEYLFDNYKSVRPKRTTEMTTKLVDDYVNFIMDGMPLKLKEEMLYEYLVNEYKDLSDEELTQQILENYGDEWFEEYN